MVFHVLNRGVGRMRLFDKPGDYAAFEEILGQTQKVRPMRICAYCIMPDHWHMVLWPRRDDDLAAFMQRLSITHVRRWQTHRQMIGEGHIYQGRYKSFPIQADTHFLTVCRYVERNPVRADLVERAEDWRWSSLWHREKGNGELSELLADWPVPRPAEWLDRVREPEGPNELEALRLSVARGRPFGEPAWADRIAKELGLENTFRSPGRPRKKKTS